MYQLSGNIQNTDYDYFCLGRYPLLTRIFGMSEHSSMYSLVVCPTVHWRPQPPFFPCTAKRQRNCCRYGSPPFARAQPPVPANPCLVRRMSSEFLSLSLNYFSTGHFDLTTDRYTRFVQRFALANIPMRRDDRCSLLLNAAQHLHEMYGVYGSAESTPDGALKYAREALSLCRERNPLRPHILTATAQILFARFLHFGTLCDLEEAFSLERQALDLYYRPLDRASSLSNLALYHYHRFPRLKARSDIHDAISLARKALELIPPDKPDFQATSLEILADSLYIRYYDLKELSDIEEALSTQLRALQIFWWGGPSRKASMLSTAALFYHARFTRRGIRSDLDEALRLERDALKLLPKGYTQRIISFTNIALYLSSSKLPSDLDDAICHERKALKLRSHGHRDRCRSLFALADYLYTRFKRSDMPNSTDLAESFDLYSQISQIDASLMASSFHLDRVTNWIQQAEEKEHDTTCLAYKTYLDLCVHHIAAAPSLPGHLTMLKKATASIAMDAFSACLRYGRFTDAVEYLEQGRAVFWSQFIRLRSPLEDIEASGEKGRELATKFTELAAALYSVLESSPNGQPYHNQTCSYSIQFFNVIAEIRKLPGFSRFLQPALFSELQIAAREGPVVIVNASKYGCDTLIVLHDRDPIRVVLPIKKGRVLKLSEKLRSLTLRARKTNISRELLELLRALWDEVVHPIVEALRKCCPIGSRIWWCPTAEFTYLPLHAAGSFRKKDQRKFADFYISSYTPTLAALIRARRERLSDPLHEQPHFLIVGQAQALEEAKLPSVNREVSSIAQRVRSVTTLTAVQDQDANVSKVAQELKSDQHAFVHFACHGIPNEKEPFEAGFALSDGRLKVEHIMQYDLKRAQLAYLSACHTTVGDKQSPDEAIHLAAAMQFAGFRSVIGTMWAVDDAHTHAITSGFYAQVMDAQGQLDHTRAARALHDTMQKISDDVPIDQKILYIHIGA